jgi:hypothetical protein
MPLTKPQKYLNDRTLFKCPDTTNSDPTTAKSVTYPTFPNPPSGPGIQSGPVVFDETMVHVIGTPQATAAMGQNAYYYAYDNYDVGPQISPTGTQVQNAPLELHYSIDWTGPNNTGPDDQQNQLKYPNADPNKTVITWCTYHVSNAGTTVVPVLLLNGSMKPAQASQFQQKGPLLFSE